MASAVVNLRVYCLLELFMFTARNRRDKMTFNAANHGPGYIPIPFSACRAYAARVFLRARLVILCVNNGDTPNFINASS